jgi:hypothetical protein
MITCWSNPLFRERSKGGPAAGRADAGHGGDGVAAAASRPDEALLNLLVKKL